MRCVCDREGQPNAMAYGPKVQEETDDLEVSLQRIGMQLWDLRTSLGVCPIL